MSQKITLCVLSLLLIFTLSPVLAADLKAATSPEDLTAAINRLAAAIEADQKNSADKKSLEKLNLAIAYLSFRSRRIEALERDITTLKSTRTNLDEAQKAWNERIIALEEKQKQTSGGMNEDLNRMIEDAKIQLIVFKERQSRMDNDIVQLENRNYELQREISVIEKFVERHLAF